MEPIFLLVDEEEWGVEILVHEEDSETESIDYGDESDQTLVESDIEIEEEFNVQVDSDVQLVEHRLDSERLQVMSLTRLENLFRDCVNGYAEGQVEAEEDYITAIKFTSGQLAILLSSAGREYKQPLHISTVKKLLESGNSRNPCDNNTIEKFTLVKIK
jgi:hypothetical protein